MLPALFALLVAGPAKPAVSIYVGPQARDGFVDKDKGVLDSIADIQRELRKTLGLRVVDDESSAALRLHVISGGIGPAAGGSAINIPVGTTTVEPCFRAFRGLGGLPHRNHLKLGSASSPRPAHSRR
jgi:hypothetical protein